MIVVKRVLRYLKGTIGQGLFYAANSTAQLHAYSDTNWATYPERRYSITGFVSFFVIP